MKAYRYVCAVLVMTLVVACGPKLPPNTSPEGKLAVRATQVVAALRATLPGLKALVCLPGAPPSCVKPTDAEKVVTKIEQAADIALQLGTALQVVDMATSVDAKVSGMNKARTLLINIQALLTSASVGPDIEGARQSLVQLFGNVTALLFAVQQQ